MVGVSRVRRAYKAARWPSSTRKAGSAIATCVPLMRLSHLGRYDGRCDGIAAIFSAPRKQLLHRDEKHRYHEQGQHHDGDHATHDAGAERLLALAARTRRDDHGGHPEHERETGHEDRPETQM